MIRAGDDRLEGAKAVAAELGWPVQRVYHVMSLPPAERAIAVPVWKEPLCGIVSTRSAIADYHRRRAMEATLTVMPAEEQAA